MSRFRLVALDLDGTTLNAEHKLSERTIRCLRELVATKGTTVAICTGRSIASVLDYLKILTLPQDFTPLVVFNGSVCLLHRQGAEPVFVFSDPIVPSAARLLIELVEEKGHVVQLYNGTTGDVYARPTTAVHTELLGQYARLVGKPQVMVREYEEAFALLPDGGSAKMLVLTEDPDAFMQTCRERLPDGLFHVIRGSPNPFFAEFLNPGINKGTALAALCEHLSIPLASCVAFGDGDNDIEMLSAVGLGVAMHNARTNVKAAAKMVTEFGHHEDGVAIQLEALLAAGHFD